MALLAYLAMRERPPSRDELAELLYPRTSRDRAYAGLRQCLSYLRDEIGEGVLVSGPRTVSLCPGTHALDVADFRMCLSRASGPREAEYLRSAVRLYRGGFLEGFFLRNSPDFEEWQTNLAEELRGQYIDAMARLHEDDRQRCDWEQAVQDARAIVRLDRLDEPAQRRLMRTLVAAGRLPEALRQYDSFRALIASEIGGVPEDETEELVAELRSGRHARASAGSREAAGSGEPGTRGPDGVESDPSPPADGAWRLVGSAMGPGTTKDVTFLSVEAGFASSAASEDWLSAAARHAVRLGAIALCRNDGNLRVAFTYAPRAIQTALALQTLEMRGGRPWPGPRRARVAVHAGVVEWEGNGFAGPVLDRLGCLAAAAHDGMVLVSGPAAERAGRWFPPGASLKPLGIHRMEDLGPPLAVHRLAHPQLRARFSRIETLESRTSNLQSQPTFLVGRKSELDDVVRLAGTDGVRLVTLTGPGGTGKTRLALHAAARLSAFFPQGTWFVDLAAARRASQVVALIAAALGVREPPGAERPLSDLVSDAIGRADVLLVLDNFEHVLEAAREVGRIMAACPGLKVLATSRELLHLLGEREFPVPPLELPEQGKKTDRSVPCESVRLFVERARSVRPDLVLTNETSLVIGEICARLDGLPLAIELAAARTSVLDPRALLEQLSSPMKVLTRGAENLPERQRTLRREVRWSYDLLTQEEQRLFRALAWIPGTFTADAADAIAGRGSSNMDSLSGLVEKSLLRRLPVQGAPRYRMLQTIREFALEELARNEESASVARRFADYAMATAEGAAPFLHGPEQARWFSMLDEELPNLTAALAWLEERGEFEQGLRIAGSLGWYWFRRGRFSMGAHWLETFLTAELGAAGGSGAPPWEPAGAGIRAQALSYLGWVRLMLGNSFLGNTGALDSFRRSLPLWRAAGDRKGEALSLVWAGWLARDSQEESPCWGLVDQAVTTARAAGDPWTLSFCLKLAYAYLPRVDKTIQEKRAAMEECISVARQTGDPFLVCQAVHGMGDMYMFLRQDAAAEPWFLDALQRGRQIGDSWSIFDTLWHLAYGRLRLEDLDGATAFFTDALRSAEAAGAQSYVGMFLGGFSQIALRRGDARRGLRLAGAEAVIRCGAEARFDQRLLEGCALPADTARIEWERGAEMGPEEAVRFALGEGH